MKPQSYLRLAAEKSGLIWNATFAAELPFAVRSQYGLKIVVWIAAFVTRRAVADFEIDNIAACTIHQLMGDALRRKTRAHTRAEEGFTDVGYQRRFTMQNVDKFVLLAMPM